MMGLLQQLRKTISYPGVWVGALGYFVDLYDLVMFGVVRVESLKSLGLSAEEIAIQGARILNWQMAGMLLGGLAMGWASDRLGRLRVLYFSILMYSLANFANGFVRDTGTYSILRFFAGMGLAGEFGVAVTLVAESLPATLRGLGTSVVGMAGFLGAMSSVLTSRFLSWRELYWVGGVIGILLLILRIRAPESPLFLKMKATQKVRDRILRPKNLLRIFLCVAVGAPTWFTCGLLFYFSPEIALRLGVETPVLAGNSIFWGYVGSLIGDISGGIISQKMGSRKRTVQFAILLCLILTLGLPFFPTGLPAWAYYLMCVYFGFSIGYWALFATLTAEQFETSVRGTTTTWVPNLVRASAIPMVSIFTATRGKLGDIQSVVAIGVCVCTIGLFSLGRLKEDFSSSLE